MAVRLLTYVGLLLEEIIHREKLKPGDRLPAVLPLVLHNGKSRWRTPLRLDTLFVTTPKDLKRYLPRLTYLLLDERRLDLDRPELEGNPTAALFRVESNETPEALPGLYQNLNDRLKPAESGLRRTVHAWFKGVVQRTFPGAIIPEGMNLEEAPMLEETLSKWRDQIAREASRKTRREERSKALRENRDARLDGMREVLLEQMTQLFGRLPAAVRRQIEEISSTQDLRKLGRRVLRAKSLEEMGLR